MGVCSSKIAEKEFSSVPVVKPGLKRGTTVMHTLGDSAQVADLGSKLVNQAEDMDREMDGSVPLLALVAHDNMKGMMKQFALVHKALLKDFRLTGTGTTCKMLSSIGLQPVGQTKSGPLGGDQEMEQSGTTCKMLSSIGLQPVGQTKSGPLGGDQEIGAMICREELQGIFFFRDPLSAHAHIADIEALMRLADCYQVYHCTNYRSAAAVLTVMHDRLKTAAQGGVRRSVALPERVAGLKQLTEDPQAAS
eukprot:CAMPEP_0204449210 /NCGR_PEP_ID=MMETSP0470-20130426/99722_1 /ASSEMBLY_ACC=CAM_ASM_000385 /TAXON_ID=2969 /ORGANISM="Oxyrrhis marina" /LENGTH=248 /DNA_ID=CAMNT_0051449023 /DNA_START=23 /DNA_END=767 /DNA_ORIENTATION=-